MKNRIKVLRTIANITQQELADKLSVSRQSVHAIESGKYIPSTVLALKVARVFQKPVEEIFELEKDD